VIGLAVYRKLVARHEDDFLHVNEGDKALVVQQAAIAGRLDAVDKWGKALTVIAIALGAVLAGITVYQTWVDSFKINP
jgi:hypothetical protein